MGRPSSLPLSGRQIETLSASADVSERTVRRYLNGEPLHLHSRRPIERALRALGWPNLVREKSAEINRLPTHNGEIDYL